MAKKATKAEAKTETPPKAARGKKICPKCGNQIAAAAPACSNCQHEFPRKPKAVQGKKRGRKPATTTDIAARIEAVQAAVALVERMGGIEEAKKKITVVLELQKL